MTPAPPMTARSCREEGREQGESKRKRLVHFVRQEAALKEFPVSLHIHLFIYLFKAKSQRATVVQLAASSSASLVRLLASRNVPK